MSENYPKDPIALWREMLGEWEKGVNAMATKTMASSEFSREMNRVLGASLQLQKTGQELLRRYFDALNLPTKDDFNSLGERLRAMEEQFMRVADAVERIAGREPDKVGAPVRVKRTKRYVAPAEEES
jgi:Poly(R)-hydroxyalkanoic acid synthase subunit (PHA_synth_III_E)